MSIMMIDGNSVGYAAQNASSLTANGQPVQAIYHSLKMIRSIRDEFGRKYEKLLVLWDDQAQWRIDIYPDYKSDRAKDDKSKKMRAEFKLQRPEIARALNMMGVDQLRAKGFEADDLAGALTQLYTKKGVDVLMVSGDRDWCQLINGKVSWYDPVRKVMCNRANFEEFTGYFSPQHFVEGRALVGDSSDCIAGVPGIGKATAPKLMSEFGSIQALFDEFEDNGEFDKKSRDLPEGLTRARKKINDFCREGRWIFERNMQLMDLVSPPIKPDRSGLNVVKGRQNWGAFEEFCEEHAFRSIRRELAMWKITF